MASTLERDKRAIVAALGAVRRGLRRAWSMDAVRLPALTLYYLAIIIALIALYGESHYSPPPFIYQGF